MEAGVVYLFAVACFKANLVCAPVDGMLQSFSTEAECATRLSHLAEKPVAPFDRVAGTCVRSPQPLSHAPRWIIDSRRKLQLVGLEDAVPAMSAAAREPVRADAG